MGISKRFKNQEKKNNKNKGDDDSSSDDNEITLQSKQKKLIYRPHDTFKLRFDSFIICLVLYNCMFLPIGVAFKPAFLKGVGFRFFDFITDIMFFIDILIHFRTTYVNDIGIEVTDNWKMAINYMKGTFLIDFLATIPFDVLIQYSQSLIA